MRRALRTVAPLRPRPRPRPVPGPSLTRRSPRPADGLPPDAREPAEESLERPFEFERERELQLDGGKPAHSAGDGGQAVGGRG